MLSLRPLSSLLRRQYSACLKSTVASPDILNAETAKPMKDMPGPKGRYAIPMIGAVFHMKPFGKYTSKTLYKLLNELHDKYGRTFKAELLGKCVVTSDSEAIGTVYRNEGRQPNRGPIDMLDYYCEKNKKHKGMASVNGDEWHQLRSATQKYMMKVNSASIYIGPQITVTNDLITRMSTRKYTPEEFREELFQYATESIGVVCFNKRLGFMDTEGKPLATEELQYLEAIKQFFELLFESFGPPLYRIYPTKLYRDFERHANTAYGCPVNKIAQLLDAETL